MRQAVAIVALLSFVAALRADEAVVVSRVDSVGLFKNGLAVVDRVVELPGPGSYRVEDVPTPVHGTFFIESLVPVTVRSTTMLVDAPLDLANGSLQDQLAGREVTVTLRDTPAPLSGKVSTIEPGEKTKPWSRQYDPSNYISAGYLVGQPQLAMMPNRFLVLESKDGRTLIDQATITSVQISGPAKTVKQRKPVLILTIGEAAKEKQTVRISYLTQGMAWAPSYRVELLDDKKLVIGQNAVIKNELADLKDVEIHLISGYPSIDFSHVTSPLALTQTWSAFFQQLAVRPRAGGGMNNGAVMQQRVMMNTISNNQDGGGAIAPPDESIDVHYESIGKQTLAEGDALAMDVAKAEAEYQRIVEWTVPDTRDANGRYIAEHMRQQDPDRYEDSAWDAVKFKNPLPFAMTTAPAAFTREGKFLGQQLSQWVSKGEETTLRITKALSIRTRATEQEADNGERQIVFIGGNDYRKVSVKGELTVHNHRKTETVIHIKRQFSGDLMTADEKPATTLREEGVWSVNRRQELRWTLTLKPGEEKTIKYGYSVLVDN